jgi:parallel beta-helix repeat protein
LKDGVSLYGGFAGMEDAISDRDIVANPTTLSGDISTVSNASDNVHHVVLAAFADATSTTRLDGFTIIGGNADVDTDIMVNGKSIYHDIGGGIYTVGGTNTLTNNSLSENSAIYGGGGISTFGGTNTLTNNSLSGNTAEFYGGGIFTSGGTNTLRNNSLSGNTAEYDGGGIYTYEGTNTLRNNSLSGNTAGRDGGGIYTYESTNTLRNNIILGNSDGISTVFGTTTLTNNIVQGGFMGDGNLDVDPLFVNQPAQGLGTSGDLRLQACSPAINAGNNADVPMGVTTDLDGNARIFDGTVDMGAYELQGVVPNSLTRYYVDVDATSGNNTGLSWENAFTDLQSAIASTCPDITEIWVANPSPSTSTQTGWLRLPWPT